LNKQLIWITLLISLPATATVEFKTLSTQIYSEAAYLDKEDVLVNSSRLTTQFKTNEKFSILGEAGDEYAVDNKTKDPYLYSHIFVGLGWRFNLGSQSYFQMTYRKKRHPEVKDQTQEIYSSSDLRMLAVSSGTLFSHSVAKETRSFGEYYGEGVFTQSETKNAIAAAYLRSGLEKKLANPLALRVFAEAFVNKDSYGYYYNNKSDIKITTALNLYHAPFGATLNYSRIAYWYDAAKYDEKTPYPIKGYSNRILLTVGGEI
jgi:hypothetical protein